MSSAGLLSMPEAAADRSGGTPAERLDDFLAGVERRALRMAEFALGDRDEAMDVVQDAMISLARRYASRPASEWPPLFHRILQNRIRDRQRRVGTARRHGLVREAEDAVEAVDPAPAHSRQLINDEAMQALARGMATLPTRQREVVELRIWQGLSTEDAARAMGVSGGSVKTHLSRALHALREQLTEYWP
jgi:RNA polymerase sigma-70 factor (ECF subfamily)